MNAVAKLEFARYQTDALAARVAEILSVPSAVRLVFMTMCIVELMLLAVVAILYFVSNGSLLPWILCLIYVLALAAILGFALGLIRVARRFLDGSLDLCELLIEVSEQVAKDYQAMQAGDVEVPTAAEIVEQVYSGVLMPIIENSVAETMGVVGRPLLWVYGKTFGGVMRRMLAAMAARSLDEEASKDVEKQTEDLIRDVAKTEELGDTLRWAHSNISFATTAIQKYFLFPVQIVFWVVLVVSLVPVGCCWYWTR